MAITEQRLKNIERSVRKLYCCRTIPNIFTENSETIELNGDGTESNPLVATYIGSTSGGIQSIQAGDNITIDDSDPLNPVVSAEVDTEGFMTLNSENEITEDWAIKGDAININTDNGLYVNSELGDVLYASPYGIDITRPNGETLNLYTNGIGGSSTGTNEGTWSLLKNISDTDNSALFFPMTSGVFRTITTSVNGEFADEYGNIELSGSGSLTLEQARQNGNVLEGDVEINQDANFILKDLDGNSFIKIGYNPESEATGIWFDNGTDLISGLRFDSIGNSFYTRTGGTFGLLDNSFTVSDGGNVNFKGIEGNDDFSDNYTDFSYVQKKYVDDAIVELGGDYIPLSGTEEDKPVTGTITIESQDLGGNVLISNLRGGVLQVQNPDLENNTVFLDTQGVGANVEEGSLFIRFYDEGIKIVDEVVAKGISSDFYYGANYDDNTYVQKKYVDNGYVISDEATLDINPTQQNSYYTFTGTTAVWTLDTLENTANKFIAIVNMGSGDITLNSNSGGNDLWDGGTPDSSMTIPAGTTMRLFNNSLTYIVNP